MRVWVYSNMRNEAMLLPYWLRHYREIADRIIVYDDESDDGTPETLFHAGVDVRPCPWRGIDDAIYPKFASQQYKEARAHADWVIWVDADEFVYHPNLRQRLEEYSAAGVSLPPVEGYAMFADRVPFGHGQIYDEISTGIPDERYSKPIVLNPAVELHWGPGRHECVTNGVSGELPGQNMRLLHYRWFGREEYLKRNADKIPRTSATNFALGLGIENTDPNYQGHHSLRWYEEMRKRAAPCL